jgi:hypothetical protein
VTKAKHPAHRLGWHSEDVQDRTQEDIRDHARDVFLAVVAKIEPAVLGTLAAVRPAHYQNIGIDDDEINAGLPPEDRQPKCDEKGLSEWAARWNLRSDWCLAYAHSTWRMWRRYPEMRRSYWCPRDDEEGRLYRPRPGRQAKTPRITPAHFCWLARYQIGTSYSTISRSRKVGLELLAAGDSWSWPDSSASRVSTVRQGCIRLAHLIRLPLRETRRGVSKRTRA